MTRKKAGGGLITTETINILLTTSLSGDCLKQIEDVSPRLKIIDAAALGLLGPSSIQNQKGKGIEQKLNDLLVKTEIIFGFRMPPNLVARAPQLKWIQIMLAGVDQALTPDILNSPVILTNMRGIHAPMISELVFNLMLMQVKNSIRTYQRQLQKKWERFTPELLDGKTLGIVGFGSIGQRLAYLGKAFGMKVVATRRSAKKISQARYAEAVYPPAQLNRLLAESDFVVNDLPLTNETLKFFSKREFQAMKPSAFFINVGRGKTVDEESLVLALQQKWIAGAGLDTFFNEPPPQDSLLWTMPQVIVTPHIAGTSKDYQQKCTAVFCENLNRYLGGKRMINVINKKRGY